MIVSFPAQLNALADARPDEPAVTCGASTVTRAELRSASRRMARELQSLGVELGDFVTVALPNSVDWFVAYVACWNIGAVPQPVSAKLPARELAAIVDLARSKVVIGAPDSAVALIPDDTHHLPIGHVTGPEFSDEPLPDATSPAWKAPTSGGSTGRPKLIVSGDPALWDTDPAPRFGLAENGCLVMPGPLYHNGPGVWACQALLSGSHVVLLPRFDAEQTLAEIERHGCDVTYMVPTMMKRILRLDDEVRFGYDLSSLRVLWHLAEPCPAWLKQAYIDWLGAECIFELYAGTEAQAATIITGTEWLDHRGSVGRVSSGEMKICDEDGNDLPVGEQGEVWMRSTRGTPTYEYLGAEPKKLDGGWESLGDIGWFDEDGYLYLGDRVADMILSGGANIYPAEVEAALNEHEAVHSCAVIGLPHEERGNDVHAIVQADPAEVSDRDLLDHLAERIAVYKLPRSFEYVDEPLRDDAGKVRRSALRDQRVPAANS
ncbi:AMP-binding protein [Ilumatobacter nonamiensis]|uniref:AMP-binding protein n=1 Tax=Ilumatobacter nonamiensis TaxID=467093 RepID=UPI000346738D|nr:AMP-binding protein [Ilumatobacter nonamiensis]